jgi:GDPmannose 4,6-dehydratase
MWLMVQQSEPDDYVLATGETHSVREFAEKAFARVGREIVWQGANNEEQGLDRKTGRTLIEVDPVYFRPTEVDVLRGDPTKARHRLGWSHKTTFDQLVNEMVDADLRQIKNERGPRIEK